MTEIVHPAEKYVVRGKVVRGKVLHHGPNARNNSLAIFLVCAPFILALKYYGAMRAEAP